MCVQIDCFLKCYSSYFSKLYLPDVLGHTFTPSTWDVEADQTGLHGEFYAI